MSYLSWRQRTDRASPLRGGLRVGLVYVFAVAAVAAWFSFSDPQVSAWVRGPEGMPGLHLLLGVAFVLLSGSVVAGLTYRELKIRREEGGQLESLIHQSLAGITVVQDERFRFVNARFADMLGYDPQELTDTRLLVTELIAPEERETVAENLRQRQESEIDDIRYRYTAVAKGGDRIRVEVHGSRVEWEGRPAVMSLHLDVTREEELRDQIVRAQRLEALGELTGAVAHDFNNLLTTIIAPLDLCEAELDATHRIWPELQEAKAGARRAVTLTRQLLDFSRRRVFRPRPIDMRELVQRSEPMLSRLTPAGVRIHLEFDDGVPPVEVDPAHFEQVLLNLVTNAADATGSNGHIWIRIYPEAREDAEIADVVLEVADDGKGMDEETMSRIFEPFFTTRSRGTGLGLSTVHGIVKQADGKLSVHSVLGRGTTFGMRLRGTAREAEPLVGGREKDRGTRVAPARPRSVLVVDDEDAVRNVTARVLTRYGFAVEAVENGDEALSRVAGGARFEVLLTDVGLPGMNGVELASRVRELQPDVTVLYMSGHSDEAVVRRMARERSSGFVEKPFTVETLLAAIAGTSETDGSSGSSARSS